jgi:predicted MFS family arabinose efflux permease
VALALLPTVAVSPAGAVLFLLIWGMAGWGTLAPQQHRLLALGGDNGPVAVSLNASALYLGSALGAGAGGVLLNGIVSITTLPLIFGLVALVAAAVNLAGGAARAGRAVDGSAGPSSVDRDELEGGRLDASLETRGGS